MTRSSTILNYFATQVEKKPDKKAILERVDNRWVPYSWREWNLRSRGLAAALLADGVQEEENVAIYSYSRREWIEADIAVLMTGARTVTIYQNLQKSSVDFILSDCSATVVFAEGPVQLRAIFGDGAGTDLPDSVRRIVYFQETQTPAGKPGGPEVEPISVSDVVPEAHGDLVVSYIEYLEKGKAALAHLEEELDARIGRVNEDTVAKVVYTSGTTGEPKGAMLSHGAMTSVVATIDDDLKIRHDDTCLLFLPLAHVYAQLTYHAGLRCGFTIAFARSMLTAVDDAESLGPDFFTTVPRLFEKIHAGVLAQVEAGGTIKRKIFNWAVDVGSQVSGIKQAGGEVSGGLKLKMGLADRLVFRKIKARLGGNVRFMISGGAPLQKNLMEFFHAADLLILEGYGMTENSSLSHFNRPGRYKFGTVGLPLDGTDVEIADDGEILVRGEGVMAGYLNQEEATKESLDPGGWLHTGDIGVVDEEGFLKITDRKKDIIVTSGGKNIAPAPIESALLRNRFVQQAVVFGDGRKFLVALVTLDQEYAESWAEENGVSARGEALAGDPRLKEAIGVEVDKVNGKLESYMTIKKFVVMPREFSMEAGEVTPSLKLRRRVIEHHNKELLASLYPPESGRC